MSIDTYLDEAMKIIKTNTIFGVLALIIIAIIFLVLVLKKDRSTVKYALILALLVLSLYFYNTLPIIIDYYNKDIIINTGYYYLQEGEGIYEGDYLIGGSMDVTFDNGESIVLTGADNGYPAGNHYGKIAYGKRSEKILGFEELQNQSENGELQ